MSGINRLRALAGAWEEWGLGGTLAEIADQIERELREERDRWDSDLSEAQVSWTAVAGVYLNMERHCLGHEGMEDSPVARWARELRGALKSDASDGSEAQNPSCADAAETADVTSEGQKVTRDPAEDVSVSVYDLLPADEREAIAWVREHGGLDHVKAEWRSRVPHDLYERRRQRLLDHIAECETALGRRRETISELTHRVSDLTNENAELRKRAMPEGCEWPRYESGEPVGFSDDVNRIGEVWRICLYLDGSFSLNLKTYSKGERVKRPAVPAGDDKPLEVGQTVWDTNGDELVVVALEDGGHTVACRYADVGDGIPTHGMWSPSDLTHQRPVLDAEGNRIKQDMDVWWICEGDERGVHAERLHVESIGEDGLVTCAPSNGGTWVELEPSELYVKKPVPAADGEPIKVGEHVWDDHGEELVVLGLSGGLVRCRFNGETCIDSVDNDTWKPSQLTHERLESWERLEEDAENDPCGYFGFDGEELCGKCPASGKNCEQTMALDIVRRARALAERERGE